MWDGGVVVGFDARGPKGIRKVNGGQGYRAELIVDGVQGCTPAAGFSTGSEYK